MRHPKDASSPPFLRGECPYLAADPVHNFIRVARDVAGHKVLGRRGIPLVKVSHQHALKLPAIGMHDVKVRVRVSVSAVSHLSCLRTQLQLVHTVQLQAGGGIRGLLDRAEAAG